MNIIRASLFTLLTFLLSFYAQAKEVTDTLYSAQNDRIIVTYNITQEGNKVDLQFQSVRKVLGKTHHDKYSDADKIRTLFFDWNGVRKDMKITGETPSIISLPAKASYKKSSDGCFVVEERPSFSFELENPEAKAFTIPLYLAHYEGKQHYKIICSCGNLKVNIPKTSTATAPAQAAKPTKKTQSQQIEINELEDEEEFSEVNDQALNIINSINRELPYQDTLPMDMTLEMKIKNLVDIQSTITHDGIAKKIDETLEAYNSKKKELEKVIGEKNKQKADDNAFANCNTKEDFDRYVKQHPNGSHVEEAKAEVDKLDAQAKEEEQSKKKRTIWMIIGGALLAILLFVGNQVMQSFRNRRTQRSMMQMQQDATRRAQSMARSKAQSEIRKQTNKATSQVRKKGQNLVRDAADKLKNNQGNNQGNNRVSI